MDNTLEENRKFWQLLFQKTDLTHQLMGDAEEMSDVTKSFEFNLTVPYGKVSVTAKPAVPLGSNFMSDVFSASAVDEQGKKYSGFVKVLPSAQSRVAAAFVGGYYQREFACYEEWIPALKKIKEAKKLTDSDIPLFVADAYYVNLAFAPEGDGYDNSTVYILENCKNKGYKLNTKAVTPAGIDLKHARAAMKTFANYHALSIAHLRKFKVTEGTYELSPACHVFAKDPNYISPAMVYRTIVLPSYSKILRHFKENETADWLDGYISRTEEVWSFESSLNSGPLTCVIHGDSWSNNILFRYAEEDSQQENPLDTLLIDWQISRIGHVFVDLGYFLFSSTSSDFRRQHLTELLTEYFSILKSALSKLDIDLEKDEDYNLDRFLKDCKDHFMIGLFVALFIMPILLDASKAVEHTLKNQETSSDPVVAEDAKGLEDKMDEEGTKAGWEGLFELTTVAANPLLSKRVVELLVDIRKWLTE